MENHIVIMAGGIGSRFWPMSTPEYPKQFIDVMGCGKSLIQLTVERFAPLCPMENFWVVTSEKYTDIVKEQLPDLPECNILAEPTARNTAPCIAYACWKIKKQHPQAKPDVETAKEYVAHGSYFWNAGIFVWNVDTITDAIRKFTPDLAAIMDEMSRDFYTAQEADTVERLFPTCEKISIDYAVMEKAESIYTLPAEFGWSDLGSWGSLRTLLLQDEHGNAGVGNDISLHNCHNCIVHTAGEKQVVVEGLDGYIIAERNGALLVCSLKEEQNIKRFTLKH